MGRIWNAIWKRVAWFFDSAMRAVVIGAILLSGILAGYHHFFVEPPGIGTVTALMNEDATAAEHHDVTVVSRIYDPSAVVTDAGCQTPGASRTWTGYAEIKARYGQLPKFLWIQHVYPQVSWDPDDRQATTADVTAETIGVIEPSTNSQKSQSIVGHELWTFARVNGHWLVTSFTYNLCLPGSMGG